MLLPYIRQVIMTQQEIRYSKDKTSIVKLNHLPTRYFHPLHTTLSLILKRFSTVLLAGKSLLIYYY